MFHRLAALCGQSKRVTLARALNNIGLGPKTEPVVQSHGEVDPDDTVGLVKWIGPDQLAIPLKRVVVYRVK